MSLQSRRRALLVTGMHRSGTSCVSRIANLTGLAIGTDLLPPQQDNAAGFWEHAGLIDVNERILDRFETSWDALAPLPDDWWQSPDLEPEKRRIRTIIERDFGDGADFVFKDPRLCLLVPLWRDVLAELGYEIRFLLVMRDVRAVIASLHERNTFPQWHSELLWLRYNLMAEFQTRDDRRALVHYEDVLRDWRATFEKVAGAIPLSLPDPGTEQAAAIDACVDPELDHASPRVLARLDEISPWSKDVMRGFSRDAALEDAASLGTFDRVRAELVAADPLLAPQDRHWRSEYLRLNERADAASKIIERFDSLGESLLQRVHASTALLQEERNEARRLHERFDVLEAELKRRHEEQVATLARERDALRERNASVEARILELETRTSELIERERGQALQIEALAADLAGRRAELDRMREDRRRTEADLEGLIEGLRSQLAASETKLAHSGKQLDAHREVLDNMVQSRSWRITRPLRGVTALFRRGEPDPGAGELFEPVPWHELLPGRPFRQRFSSPHPRLAGLGVTFFTYGRENRTSVRVRILAAPSKGHGERLIEEFILEGHHIRDGEASEIEFADVIGEANARSFIIEIESLDGEPGRTVSVALGPASYPGRVLSRDRRGERRTRGLLLMALRPSEAPTRKAFAFVSGCPGGAYRYRCEHPAEALRLRGYSVDVLPADEFPWSDLLGAYQVVVAHRVPHTPEFESFVAEAARRKVHVVFDTDDLVFAPEIEDQIAALDDLSESERALWLDGVQRYRKSLTLVDRSMVSTPALARSLSSRLPLKVAVTPNHVSDEMVRQAQHATRRRSAHDPSVRIGYLSGTPTHRRDFAECVPALAILMEHHAQVRLSLIGHIDVPQELLPFSHRIDLHPLVPWQELPSIYADLDVNLAPLELDNEFTEGKSELKFFEAALLGVPTVASGIGSYSDAISAGEDGFLCSTTQEWFEALERLVTDGDLRRRVGQAARETAYRRYTSRAACEAAVRSWLELLETASDTARPLRVAMVVRAPIARTGGGYKKVFQLVNHLSTRGHAVTVYVEPIAHLSGRSPREIEDYCREHFECGNAAIVTGHEAIDECDVAIATNWPTANVVNDLPNARLRLYFIQDDEREFYEPDDPLREAAGATYDLPLLIVAIGGYLARLMGERNRLSYPHVDFALSDVFFEDRAAVREKIDRLPDGRTPSLLFFARPGIPRRAFDLGVDALSAFHRQNPEVEIRLYGLEESLELPFPYVDLGVIDQVRVAAEMRGADVHLSFSRTNGSTVIFEAMASGAVAVELDVESVRSLIDEPGTCVLCEDCPDSVATALFELFGDRERMRRIALAGFESVEGFTVQNMCRQFEEIVTQRVLPPRTAV